MNTEIPTPQMSPEVRQEFERLKAEHLACVKAGLEEGRSPVDAHILCAHVERQITALATAHMNIVPEANS